MVTEKQLVIKIFLVKKPVFFQFEQLLLYVLKKFGMFPVAFERIKWIFKWEPIQTQICTKKKKNPKNQTKKQTNREFQSSLVMP